MDDEDLDMRVVALAAAVLVNLASEKPAGQVVAEAREFYAFLTGVA